MKKLIFLLSIGLLMSGLVYAATDITLADSTPSRWVAYSGSGWISHATLISAGDVRITCYDTSTNTATSGVEPILMGGNSTTDSAVLVFDPDPGSYIKFSKGIQITSTGHIDFLRINIRGANGAGGSGITRADTTAVRWVAINEACWISDIAVSCSVATEITIYDLNTNTSVYTTQPVFKNYYEPGVDEDTNVLKWYQLPAGSYIRLKYGAQVTTSARVYFIWINRRSENGAN